MALISSMPARFAGLCSGASRANSRIAAITASSTTVEALNRSPVHDPVADADETGRPGALRSGAPRSGALRSGVGMGVGVGVGVDVGVDVWVGVGYAVENAGDDGLVAAVRERLGDGVAWIPADPQQCLRGADLLGQPAQHALAGVRGEQRELDR